MCEGVSVARVFAHARGQVGYGSGFGTGLAENSSNLKPLVSQSSFNLSTPAPKTLIGQSPHEAFKKKPFSQVCGETAASSDSVAPNLRSSTGRGRGLRRTGGLRGRVVPRPGRVLWCFCAISEASPVFTALSHVSIEKVRWTPTENCQQ